VPFLDVLLHRAVPLSVVEEGEWVEGERVSRRAFGTPFRCVLFLPQGTETAAGRLRKVREPLMLYGPLDEAGGVVALGPEDQVDVTAPELHAAEGLREDVPVRYQVAGAPQPFGKPGAPVIGFQVTLRRIED